MALSEAGSAKGRRRRYREDDKENVSLVDENSQIRSADKRLKILYAIPGALNAFKILINLQL